jgi:gamma-glutamyltranspeptidase
MSAVRSATLASLGLAAITLASPSAPAQGTSARDAARAPTADTSALIGARSPAYAADGRLVVSIDGHLMLQRTPGASLQPLTSGAGWDRDPAWTADGGAIVFASDRTGNYDLWRLTVNADGSAGALTQLTRTPQHETSPTVARDGRIAFLRGGGNATRVWVLDTAGKESRLTTSNDTERAPRFTPNDSYLAFLAVTEAGRRLQVWSLAAGASAAQRWSQTVDASTDYVSWAWDHERLAISTRAGVFIVPRLGGYTNFASSARGHTAWSPDDRTIAVASFDDPSVAYNGDPDRGSDRSAVLRPATAATERLSFVAAPVAPNVATVQRAVALDTSPAARSARNGAAFDRLWERSTRLYFSTPEAAARRGAWERVRVALRPRALAATSDSALDGVLHELLAQRPTLRESARGRAAVSSAHPVSTEAGLEVLRKGGSVVDAAVAVSFALGVVEPDASGIAGYGEMVIALKSLPKPTLIEFMSRVPEDAGLSNTSLLVNGRYPSDGPVLVNVPGTVSGMHTAWLKYGSKSVPWAELLAPAIRAARDGYVVSEGLATTLATEREHFAKYEGSRALFFRNGEPLRAGDTLKNPDLAWVLEQIAKQGADGFYKGEVATKWVNDLRAKGNAMKLSDLARYFAPEREPVSGTYRNYTIYSGAPPVSGGAELVARLNLLEQYPSPKSYRDDAASMHAALSAWFLVPSSRGRIADPALWPIDVAPIINKDTARIRWGCYAADKALTPDAVRGDTLACLKAATKPSLPAGAPQRPDELDASSASPCGDDHAAEMTVCHAAGTTAFTVADNDGNMVAVTQTLGTWGGNFYVTPGLGFLSNDKLTSYGTDPTQYGSRLPFSRHGSTIAPTIAYKNGKPFAAVGAAGNAWITSAVYQTLLGVLDYDLGPQEALELPRFLPGGGFGGAPATGAARQPTPYTLQLEDGFSPIVIARLRALGYNLSFVSLRGEVREGYGAAVRVDGKVVTAGADPRRAGAAGAIKP